MERWVQTFRTNLQRRLDVLNQDKSDWIKHIDNILKKYDNTIHNIIQIEPINARKPMIFFVG